MLKLLLKEESQKIKKEYIRRFIIVLFFGLSAIMFLFIVSLIPSYFILKLDQKVLNAELSSAQNEELNNDRLKLKEKLNSLRSTLNILDTKQYEVSYLIQNVTERQTRDVNITGFAFDGNYKNKELSPVFIIQGNANSREALANFIEVLNQVPEFSSASLPFSSFAKDSEIPFSITINLPPLTKTNE